MKKTIITLATFICVFNIATAARLGIGIRIGGNLPTVKSEATIGTLKSTISSDAKFGFYGGLVADIGFGKLFSFAPEVLYSIMPSEYKLTSAISTEVSISYLTVPLLLRISVGVPKIKVYANAGPYVGIMLGNNYSSVVNGVKSTVSTTSNNISSLDYGVCFGGGVMIGVGPGSFVLDGRYYLGLADINKTSSSGSKSSLNNIQFGIGYMFYLIGK
ncbi:MAG: porin family protein [Cytophagales bacterium]|nr:porin family protein [Cytophagales bacterium]